MTFLQRVLVVLLVSLIGGGRGAELIHNGDMESMSGWHCSGAHCDLSSDHHCGSHSMKISHRGSNSIGITQSFNATAKFLYQAKAAVKLLNDKHGQLGQELTLTIVFDTGSHRSYEGVAAQPLARSDQGWIQLQGDFIAPDHDLKETSLRINGLDPSVDFLVDCVSVTNIWRTNGWRAGTDKVIHDVRMSDVTVNVRKHGNIHDADISIQLLQKKKSFPVGTVVNSWAYEDEGHGLYRDFIHKHFNWAVFESTLKWKHIEPQQGSYHFDRPLRLLDAMEKHGIKVRGHNLIWSTDGSILPWVKGLSGNHLRDAVKHHITQTMNKTRGRLEHWDVNNENLQGQWYQEKLQDFDYEQEPYRIAHHNEPHVKLFLNDYRVVAHGKYTGAYLAQAKRLLKANVGLGGLGAQCHFYDEESPDPYLIKSRLDILAQAGLPIWITEFNVVAADEDKRANFVEFAMRAFYGHPAVKGILLWGFWDQSHSRGPHAALTKGNNMQLTAAGRRFLDLWENQWMTDETRNVGQAGQRFTVRAFHGDYELHVHYRGKDMTSLKQTFSLGKSAHTVNVDVHV